MKSSGEREGKIQREEWNLLERCRNGDQSGYLELYDTYSRMVFGLALRMLNNEQLAEDAVQEVFIKVFRGLESFQRQSKLSTWLYRITANQCRDMLRTQQRRIKVYSRPVNPEEDLEEQVNQIADEKPLPDKQHQDKELGDRIRLAIDRLPLEFRETIYLKEIEGLSYEEISEIVGCRIGTVKSRIFRARELLQEELKDFYKEFREGQ